VSRGRDAALVALSRALVSALCLLGGFRAISDDDYSRVVLAARFADTPSLDPSGTSWLPLPFWFYGALMALLGDSLGVARAAAVLLGIGSAVGVWGAARLLGLGDRPALLGAVGAALLPYGAFLSVATVPEAPAAALILIGAACAARTEARWRLLGGVALGAACLCRYEAWGPAFAFGLLCALDAVKSARLKLGLGAIAALTPPALWMLHGYVQHGSALFFVGRVKSYQAALGVAPEGALQAALNTVFDVVRFEPELCGLTLVALVLSLLRGGRPFGNSAWGPPFVLGALLLFLVAARAGGSSATHHPERSLLAIHWFLTLLAAGLLSHLANLPGLRWLLPMLAAPSVVLGSLLLRPDFTKGFVDRSEEERVGSMLRQLGAARVLLDTDDFGYFAIQAALGAGRSQPLEDRDPRRRSTTSNSNQPALKDRLRDADWLVTTRERSPLARELGTVRATTKRFVVIQLRP
jgi:hypothetical protein